MIEEESKLQQAITAFKEALAQSAVAEPHKQAPVGYDVRCDTCGGNGLDPKNNNYYCSVCNGSGFLEKLLYTTLFAAQPAQEKCRVCGEGEATLMVIRECNKCGSEYAGKAEFDLAKAQRTWVGLTPKEVAEIVIYPMNKTADLVRTIEAKLKEKNA